MSCGARQAKYAQTPETNNATVGATADSRAMSRMVASNRVIIKMAAETNTATRGMAAAGRAIAQTNSNNLAATACNNSLAADSSSSNFNQTVEPTSRGTDSTHSSRTSNSSNTDGITREVSGTRNGANQQQQFGGNGMQ